MANANALNTSLASRLTRMATVSVSTGVATAWSELVPHAMSASRPPRESNLIAGPELCRATAVTIYRWFVGDGRQVPIDQAAWRQLNQQAIGSGRAARTGVVVVGRPFGGY
jgi:hypothetical protein